MNGWTLVNLSALSRVSAPRFRPEARRVFSIARRAPPAFILTVTRFSRRLPVSSFGRIVASCPLLPLSCPLRPRVYVLEGRPFFPDGSLYRLTDECDLPLASFRFRFFLGGRLLCNSGALSLAAVSASLRSPGCVFCRFSLLRLVFWFSLLPLVPPICLFLVLSGSGVILSRCLVAYPGFAIFENGPCVLTVASLWLRRPCLGYPVFQALLFRCSACLSLTSWRYGVFRFRCFVLRPRFPLCGFL